MNTATSVSSRRGTKSGTGGGSETPVALTVDEAVRRAARRLAGAGPTARLDAELLCMQATGFDRAALLTRQRQALPAAVAARFEHLVTRRLAGEPVAYITARREFWSLELKVAPGVLIPRPDTETLVARTLTRIPAAAAWRIADLGTGSGAVALALARERPDCRVLASDICPDALALAAQNAARLGIGNVDFVAADWLAPLAAARFHLIVSNPPYVAAADPHLGRGDLRFEPARALVAGNDGLDAIRTLVEQAPARLVPGGRLLLEHGHDQGAAVRALLCRRGFRSVAVHQDAGGHDRVSEGVWANAVTRDE